MAKYELMAFNCSFYNSKGELDIHSNLGLSRDTVERQHTKEKDVSLQWRKSVYETTVIREDEYSER